ncbi:MAG: hypothetical protein IKE89_04515 [Bacilli bacterium]|nr:hypothetical protein [Bacilli bacterium]
MKVVKVLWHILEVIIICYVVFITACILFRNGYGYTQFGPMTVVTVNDVNVNDFENISNGSLLLIKDSNSFKVDDEVFYYDIRNQKYIVVSDRIVNIEDGKYIVDGVNENNEVVQVKLNNKKIIGKNYVKIGILGYLVDLLESRIGFLLLVILPIFIVFLYELIQFVIAFRTEKNSARNSGNNNTKMVDKVNYDDDII